MGFKVKRWGAKTTLNVQDYYAGASSVGPPDTKSYIRAFAGRIVFLCYDETSAPVWFTFDPATWAWTGPHAGPTTTYSWTHWSGFDGDDFNYSKYGEQYLLGYGMFTGTLWSNGYLRVITPEFNLVEVSAQDFFPGGSTSQTVWGGGVGCGVTDGGPCRVAHLFYKPIDWVLGDPTSHDIVTYGPGGLITRLDATSANASGHSAPTDLYWRDYWNTEQRWGTAYTLDVAEADCSGGGGRWLFASFPNNTNKCFPTAKVSALSPHPGSLYVLGSAVYGAANPDVGADYWAEMHDLTTEVTPPFSTTWDYRRLRDGLFYALDGGDLDGIQHGIGVPNTVDPTYSHDLGYYLGLSTDMGTVSALHYLDPHQKTSWAGWPGIERNSAIAWVGEAAITSRLRLQDVLSLGRPANLGARAAVELADKTYVQDAVVSRDYQTTTPLIVRLVGYPTSDPDWWFPGSDGDHYHGFWDIFGHDGDSLVIARMPDPMWGMYNPLGADVMYGMGLTTENDDLSVNVANSMKIVGTNFAGPISAANHRQLIGCPDAKSFVWLEANVGGFQMPPTWEAKVGHLVQTSPTSCSWVTDIDFKNRQPGLGEDGGVHEDWSVWCVQPIPPCRPLPKGGWLVGATLYFLPWGTNWAWDAGSRDATFRSTGLNYVPSLPSYLGPVPVANSPAYYVDLDEWTQGRSVYGSDALLVYDETGAFVECLSDATTYPANGRAFAVTRGQLPKVIYRVYRWSQYSDSAEYWGCWQDGAGDADLNVGMWACYDLFSGSTIEPGFGAFRGFVDPSGVAPSNLQASPWRWNTVANNLYETTTPKLIYPAPGSGEMRIGQGGQTVTLLGSRDSSSRQGTKGVGQRS